MKGHKFPKFDRTWSTQERAAYFVNNGYTHGVHKTSLARRCVDPCVICDVQLKAHETILSPNPKSSYIRAHYECVKRWYPNLDGLDQEPEPEEVAEVLDEDASIDDLFSQLANIFNVSMLIEGHASNTVEALNQIADSANSSVLRQDKLIEQNDQIIALLTELKGHWS